MASLPGHSSKKRLKPSPSASFQALRSLCRSGTRGRRCAPTIHCQNFLKKKTADFLRNQRFYGCGDRTRTCDLRVMRQSQAQIGVISAPICAFYHRSLGGFSIVSVQPCPLFSDSGSKLGQYGILIFFRKPSIFVVVSSDASVNNPSSVSSGVSKTDLMLTATLAQDAMTVLDSALY